MAAFSRISEWTYLRGALDYHLLNGIYISNNLEQFVLDDSYLVMRSLTGIRSEIKCKIKKQTNRKKQQHYKQEVCLNFLSLPCHFVRSAECCQVSLLNIRWIQVIRSGTQWSHPLRASSGNTSDSCRENPWARYLAFNIMTLLPQSKLISD